MINLTLSLPPLPSSPSLRKMSRIERARRFFPELFDSEAHDAPLDDHEEEKWSWPAPCLKHLVPPGETAADRILKARLKAEVNMSRHPGAEVEGEETHQISFRVPGHAEPFVIT